MAIDDKDYQRFKQLIAYRESRGNYKAENSGGFLGRYQFGAPRLYDLGLLKRPWDKKQGSQKAFLANEDNWTIKGGKERFLNDPELQEQIADVHFKRLFATINKNNNLSTEETFGRTAASHLLGTGGMKDLIYGKKDRTDANGTKASDYYNMAKNFKTASIGKDIDVSGSVNINQDSGLSTDTTPVKTKDLDFKMEDLGVTAGALLAGLKNAGVTPQKIKTSVSNIFKSDSKSESKKEENKKEEKKSSVVDNTLKALDGVKVFTKALEIETNGVSDYSKLSTEVQNRFGAAILKQLEETNTTLKTFVNKVIDNQDTSIKHNTPTPVSKANSKTEKSQEVSENSGTGLGIAGLAGLASFLLPEIASAIRLFFNSTKLLTWFKDLLESVPLIKSLKSFGSSLFDGLKTAIEFGQKWIPKIGNFFSKEWAIWSERLGKIWGYVSPLLGGIKDAAVKAGAAVVDGAKSVGKSLVSGAKSVWGEISSTVSSTVDSVKNSETVKTAVSATKDFVAPAAEKAVSWWDKTKTFASETWDSTVKVANETVDVVKAGYDYTKGLVTSGWQTAKGFVNSKLVGPFIDWLEKYGAPIVDGAKKYFNIAINSKVAKGFMDFLPGGGIIKKGMDLFDSILPNIDGKSPLTWLGSKVVDGFSKLSSNFATFAKKLGLGGAIKYIFKRIPVIGLLLSIPQALRYLADGDYTKAGAAIISGIAGLFPGAGTAISAGIDAMLLADDMGVLPDVTKVLGSEEPVNVSDLKLDDLAPTSGDVSKVSDSVSGENDVQGVQNPGYGKVPNDVVLSDKNDIFSQVSYSNSYPYLVDRNITELYNSSSVQSNVLSSYDSVLTPIFRAYPDAFLSSGFRGNELNSKVGGKSESKHKSGQAFDIQFKNHNVTEVMNAIANNEIPGLKQDGYYLHEGSWLHAQAVPGHNSKLRTAVYDKSSGHASAFVPTRAAKQTVMSVEHDTSNAEGIANLSQKIDDTQKAVANVANAVAATTPGAQENTLRDAMNSNVY
jgi:lysM domain protein|nr:MAG TPA: peptidase [Caudoviricetes sp.]